VGEKTKRPSWLRPEGRITLRHVLMLLTLWAFFGAAAVNFLVEPLGPTLKTQLLLVSVFVLVFYYGYRAFQYLDRLAPFSGTTKSIVTVVVILIAVVWATRAISNVMLHRTHPEYRFLQRVDRIVQREYRLYENPYRPFIPSRAYRWAKSEVFDDFERGLFDYVHRYSRIDVFCYDIADRGIKEWCCQGSTYRNRAKPFHFVFQGETKNIDPDAHVGFFDRQTGEPCDVTKRELPSFPGNFTILGTANLKEPDFDFVRNICVKDALSDSLIEGFIVDLRSIVHLPDSVTVTFVTDKDPHGVDVWRLSYQRSLQRWLMGLPFIECQPLRQRRKLRVTKALRDSLCQEIVKMPHPYPDTTSLQIHRWSLPCQGWQDGFVLKYGLCEGGATSD